MELEVIIPALRGIYQQWAQVLRAHEDRIQGDYDDFAERVTIAANKMGCVVSLYIYGNGEDSASAVGVRHVGTDCEVSGMFGLSILCFSLMRLIGTVNHSQLLLTRGFVRVWLGLPGLGMASLRQ